MKRLNTAFFLALTLFSAVASATETRAVVKPPKFAPGTSIARLETTTGGVKLLSAADLSAGQTLDFYVNGQYSKLLVGIVYTNSAATDFKATVWCSLDGTIYLKRQVRDLSGSTAALTDWTDNNAVSGDESFYTEHDVRGCIKFRLVFSGTSSDASDVFDVYATAVAGD